LTGKSILRDSTMNKKAWRFKAAGLNSTALKLFIVLFAPLISEGIFSSESEPGQLNVDEPVHLAGEFARLDDITMYYEVTGNGEPVIMIHGIFGDHTRWTQQAVPLSSEFKVITPDSRGRGRTSDGEGPLSYGRMAADMVGLMDHLGIRKAHMIGHSEGGGIVLHALVDYPDRVASAVLIGTFYNVNNKPAAFQQRSGTIMDKLARDLPLTEEEQKEVIEGPFAYFKQSLLSQAPDPSRFSVVMAKMHSSFTTQPTYTLDVLRTINRPVLVVKAGNDALVPALVFDDLASSIPNAEVAEFPQAGHMVMVEQADEINQSVKDFIRRHPIEISRN